MSDQIIDVDLTIHISVYNPGHIRPVSGDTESGSSPNTTSN